MAEIADRQVKSDGTIRYRGRFYRVPDDLAGVWVTVVCDGDLVTGCSGGRTFELTPVEDEGAS